MKIKAVDIQNYQRNTCDNLIRLKLEPSNYPSKMLENFQKSNML